MQLWANRHNLFSASARCSAWIRADCAVNLVNSPNFDQDTCHNTATEFIYEIINEQTVKFWNYQ